MNHAVTPAPLSVELRMDPEMAKGLDEAAHEVERVAGLVISSDQHAAQVNDELKGIKRRIASVEEWRARFTAPAKSMLEAAAALFNPALASLKQAETIRKDALATYTTEQNRLREEARRKREAEEAEARRVAAAKAAEERAKADAEAAALRKKAEDEERKAAELAAAGRGKAAAAAAAKAEQAKTAADAAVFMGNQRAAMAQLTPEAVTAPEVPAPVKLDGFSMRDNWVAERDPAVGDEELVMAIARALVGTAEMHGRADLLVCLKVDTAAIGRKAKLEKGGMRVPGFRGVNKPVAASSAK